MFEAYNLRNLCLVDTVGDRLRCSTAPKAHEVHDWEDVMTLIIGDRRWSRGRAAARSCRAPVKLEALEAELQHPLMPGSLCVQGTGSVPPQGCSPMDGSIHRCPHEIGTAQGALKGSGENSHKIEKDASLKKKEIKIRAYVKGSLSDAREDLLL